MPSTTTHSVGHLVADFLRSDRDRLIIDQPSLGRCVAIEREVCDGEVVLSVDVSAVLSDPSASEVMALVTDLSGLRSIDPANVR